MIDTFNIDNSFWEEHPDMKAIEPFKGLYSKDKSKGKKDSSLIMWFISLCYSPRSKYYLQPPEEKHMVIGEDFCNNVNYYGDNEGSLSQLIPVFVKCTLTESQQHVHALKELMHRRTAFINSQDYNLDNYDKLDKMVIGTKSVFDNLKKAEDSLVQEGEGGSVAGGAVESLID